MVKLEKKRKMVKLTMEGTWCSSKGKEDDEVETERKSNRKENGEVDNGRKTVKLKRRENGEVETE